MYRLLLQIRFFLGTVFLVGRITIPLRAYFKYLRSSHSEVMKFESNLSTYGKGCASRCAMDSAIGIFEATVEF